MNGQAAAGWYHAEGDPVGTLRYWDGAQWVGEPQYPPQPVAQQAHSQVPPQEAAPFQPAPSGPESWSGPAWSGYQGPALEKGGIGARLLAYIVDIFITLVPFIVLSAIGGDNGALAGVGALTLIGVFLWNSVYRQGTTGQSVGKSALNVTLLGKDDLQPIGVGRALGRALLGWVLNSIFPIDLIWALFDGQNQRLVDKILNSNVYKSQIDL